MRNFLSHLFLLLFLCTFPFGSAYATLYKCIDENGMLTYTLTAVQKGKQCKLLELEHPEDVIKGIDIGFSYHYMGLRDSGIGKPHILGAKIYFETLTDDPALYNQLVPYMSKIEKIDIDCKDKKYALSSIELYGGRNLSSHEYTAYPTVSQRFMKTAQSSSSYEATVNYVCKSYYLN